MYKRNTKKHEPKTVRGYVVEVPNKQDGSDDDHEDDDEEDNWLDYSQIANAFTSGTFLKKQKKPQYCRVTLMDLDHPRHTHTCFGRFVFLDPWWEITVSLDCNSHVQGLTQYRVRQDEEGIVQQRLVPFLLNTALRRCFSKDDAEMLMCKLETFMRDRAHNREKLLFEDLDPLLYQFTQANPEWREGINQVRYQDCIQAVLRGLRYPDLLSFLCHLFPLSFLSCLLTHMDKTLAALQEAANKEPWVFGFKTIMSLRFKVFGLEAGYRAFETCGLMDSIPQVQKDALYVYEVLKNDAACNGHTYISLTDLKKHRHWANLKHDINDWVSALTYLTDNGVTVEERFNSRRNIFLYHNWKSEVDIASGLKEVMARAIRAGKPPWNVDFSSLDLRSLQRDSDQWSAAQKVAGSPICIMSGKGGCGKTTVITQLIKHVCQQIPETSDEVCEDKGDHFPADMGTNAKLHRVNAGTPCNRNLKGQPVPPPPPLPQVTQEQLTQMIQTATKALEERQAGRSQQGASYERSKLNKIEVDLTTDLIKYLGTKWDTALSHTPNGRRILLTAPTGKAASLLGHKAKMESCTLHRVIYSYRAFIKQQKQQDEQEKRKEGGGEEENFGDGQMSNSGKYTRTSNNQKRPGTQKSDNKTLADCSSDSDDNTQAGTWKYAQTKVLIVDECSLVSLRIFATLLNILIENTPLCKIVLLGDVRQLPSIEPGNFLEDMFATLRERGLSVELRTNHRSESELIVKNATRISQRQLPIIDPVQHFHFMVIEDSRDSADPDRDEAVRQLLGSCPELISHESSQFVAFRRVDCDAVNELCCMHYNNHSTREARMNSSKQPLDFRIGDKICFRKNGQLLNQGLRLRGYLQNFPEVLEAFGIAKKEKNMKNKKTTTLDATAAAEEVFNSSEDEKNNEFHPQSSNNFYTRSLRHQYQKKARDMPRSLLPQGRDDSRDRSGEGKSTSQKPGVCIKQEKLEDGQYLAGDMSGKRPSSASTGMGDCKQQMEEKINKDSYITRQQIVSVKQEKPWRNEKMNSVAYADYLVQATDFGISMEHHGSQIGDAVSHTAPSASDRQARLADVGAEDSVFGEPGSAEGSSVRDPGSSQDRSVLPRSGQDKHKEKERAGKLKNEEVRLSNGEVFFIMDDVTERDGNEGSGAEMRYLTLSDRDPECPRVVCVSYKALKRECHLVHSWARTIHTYQGSESDTVVYYVGESKVQNWKHVYTAVTRARKSVLMVGKESHLRQAVWRGNITRRSRLSRRLNDMIKDLSFQELHAMMRTINEQARLALLSPSMSIEPCTYTSQSSMHAASHSPSPFVFTSPSALDAFPDSDDSWVNKMSPVWAADYLPKQTISAASQNTPERKTADIGTAAAAEGWKEEEADLYSTPKKHQPLEEQKTVTTPKRRNCAQDQSSPVTEKKQRSDPIDSIISPVRKTLNI